MKLTIGHFQSQTSTLPFKVDFEQHALILGKSGTGKSSLLKNIFIEHVRQGWGATQIDPHGDLTDSSLECIPQTETKRVIVFDPASDRPIGLAFFGNADPELAADILAGIIQEIWPAGWGPRTDELITSAALAVLEKYGNPTILHIYDFFAHDENRKAVLAQSKNPVLRDFDEMFHLRWDKRQREEAIAAPSNKIRKFVLNPYLRDVFGQTKTLDFKEVMDTKKVLLCRLPRGRLGTGVSRIMGKVIVYKELRAALERDSVPIPERVPHLLMIDEAANFADGDVLGELFAEARKYKLSLCLAVQRLTQFKDPQEVLGSVSTEIVFRPSGRDAQTMEEEFASKWPAERFVELPNRTVIAQAIVDNVVQGPHRVEVNDVVEHRKDKDSTPDAVRRWSAENWGKPRQQVQEEISDFLQRRRDANVSGSGKGSHRGKRSHRSHAERAA